LGPEDECQPFLTVLNVHDRLCQRLRHLGVDIDLGLTLLGDLIGLDRALDELETDRDVAVRIPSIWRMLSNAAAAFSVT
jgi:hypothetical protein